MTRLLSGHGLPGQLSTGPGLKATWHDVMYAVFAHAVSLSQWHPKGFPLSERSALNKEKCNMEVQQLYIR